MNLWENNVLYCDRCQYSVYLGNCMGINTTCVCVCVCNRWCVNPWQWTDVSLQINTHTHTHSWLSLHENNRLTLIPCVCVCVSVFVWDCCPTFWLAALDETWELGRGYTCVCVCVLLTLWGHKAPKYKLAHITWINVSAAVHQFKLYANVKANVSVY